MIQTSMHLVNGAELVYASSAPPGGGQGAQGLVTALMFAAMFGIIYFLLIRPQQRQKHDREKMLSALKRGDRVVTTSGMHGTVTGLGEHTVTLRVADQVKLEFDRSAVGRIVTEGQADRDA